MPISVAAFRSVCLSQRSSAESLGQILPLLRPHVLFTLAAWASAFGVLWGDDCHPAGAAATVSIQPSHPILLRCVRPYHPPGTGFPHTTTRNCRVPTIDDRDCGFGLPHSEPPNWFALCRRGRRWPTPRRLAAAVCHTQGNGLGCEDLWSLTNQRQPAASSHRSAIHRLAGWRGRAHQPGAPGLAWTPAPAIQTALATPPAKKPDSEKTSAQERASKGAWPRFDTLL